MKSKRCVFLGYINLHKGYKCLDAATERLYISRDVLFNENIFYLQLFIPVLVCDMPLKSIIRLVD
jgi:hypothetical protein